MVSKSKRDAVVMNVSRKQADQICTELSNNPAYYVRRSDYPDGSSRIAIVYFKSREIGLKRYLVEVLV